MPITSHQVGGMIGGQQAAFGNFASYSQQISPRGQEGIQPTYQNPMQGGGRAFAPPPPPNFQETQLGMNMGPAAISAMGNVGLPTLGMAAMGGSFLPGRAGRAFGMMDPFMAGMGGAARGMGIAPQGTGMLARAGSTLGQMGGIARGGIGSILRAGIGGLGGAALAAAPAMMIGGAAQYGIGQMAQGAQFQNQVQGYLQNQFRQLNPQAQTGFGFSREQGADIAGMVRTMGHQDMMTSPQELLRVMKQGVGSGHFRAVQDAKEFKSRFKEMVKTLKTISEDMSTTLEGAMPFFQRSKQMGFWTPQDIVRSSQMTRQAAQATGQSVAQTQAMMSQGAAMARQVGAVGAAGATGMARAMGLVGGGLRGGVISEQALAEATGGQTGAAAIRSMAGGMQAGTTRFAAGRTGRWLLAALGGKGFQGFSQANLQKLMSGNMSVGDISRMARQNISRQGAFNFRMNEERLRGQLLRQGPMAQAAFIRGIAGQRLFGRGARDRYVTRRLVQRYFGGTAAQADLTAKLARDAPQIMEANRARSAAVMDQTERERERMMEGSVEGLKRKASQWWDRSVRDPLQKFGAQMSKAASDWWEKTTDRLWGRTARGFRLRGITREMGQGMRRMALGEAGAGEELFGRRGNLQRTLAAAPIVGARGEVLRGGVAGISAAGLAMGRTAPMRGAFGRITRALTGDTGITQMDMRRLHLRQLAIPARAGAKGVREAETQAMQMMRTAQAGIAGLTKERAQRLGYDTTKQARTVMSAAQKEIADASYLRAAQAIRTQAGEQSTAMERGARMVAEIRAGRVGGEALSRLVGKQRDVSIRDAVARLATAQTAERREGVAGLSFKRDIQRMGGITHGRIQDVNRQLAARQQDLSWKLTHFTSGEAAAARAGPAAAAVLRGRTGAAKKGQQQAFMDLMRSPQAGQVRRALRLMNTGTTKEERTTNRKRAMDMFTELSDKRGLSDEQRNVLRQMGNPNDPDRGNLDKVMEQMGAIEQGRARLGVADVMERRMRRMRVSLGKDRAGLVERMNKLQVKGPGGPRGFGTLMEEMMAEQGSKRDPREFMEQIRDVARMASEATGEDKQRIAEMMQRLSQVQGAEPIVAALRGGAELRGAAERLTGRGRGGRGRGAKDIANILGGMGISGAKTITGTELRKLRAGGKRADAAQDKILKRFTEGVERQNVRKLIEGVKQGGPEGMQKILEVGRNAATARGMAMLKEKDKDIKNQIKSKAMAGEVLGDLGSTKGMHAELTRQTNKMDELIAAVKGEKSKTGNPQEGAGTGQGGT